MILKTFTFLSMTILTLFIIWASGLLWFAANVSLAKPNNVKMSTDAIIVLTGGTGRIDEGIKLLKDTKTKKLFISGVNPNVTQNDFIKDENKGICCIFLGYTATNTKENALEVKEWIDKNNVKKIRLVTSNYHMMRAMIEIKKSLPDIEIISHPVIPKNFNIWDSKFWSIIFSEYNKTLLIWLGLSTSSN